MMVIKRLAAVAVVFILLLSSTACSKYSPAKEYTNVTLGGLTLDVRSDMKFDDTKKDEGGEKLESYYCDYFGILVMSESSAVFKLEGYNDAAAYLKCVIEANNLDSEVKTSNDKVYMDYKDTVDGVEFTYSAYALELGYRYYIVNFFAESGKEKLYRAEYEKILDTVRLAEVPPETKEITISGIKMTVGGDVEKESDEQYYNGKYFIFALSDEMVGVTFEEFAYEMVTSGDFITADGDTSDVSIYDNEIAFFEHFDNGQYAYNYVKNIDSYIVYIMFVCPNPADDDLKAEFSEIVKNATLA